MKPDSAELKWVCDMCNTEYIQKKTPMGCSDPIFKIEGHTESFCKKCQLEGMFWAIKQASKARKTSLIIPVEGRII